MREQMLDEDPAKREAWSAESSPLYYWYLKTTYHLNIQKQKKNENNKVHCYMPLNLIYFVILKMIKIFLKYLIYS